MGSGLSLTLCAGPACPGQVTTKRLVALLNGIGVEISKRQVVRLLAEPLDGFVAEDKEVLRAASHSRLDALASAGPVCVER